MDLSSLKPAKGSIKKSKRIGRGPGSGRGGTSTRGHKGAKSRSGYKSKRGFEGGQMPLYRRVPKFGFKNINKVTYRSINLQDLQKLSEKLSVEKIGIMELVEGGLASRNDKIKILGKGKLTSKLQIEAHAFSQSAMKAIEEVGGAVSNLSQKSKTE